MAWLGDWNVEFHHDTTLTTVVSSIKSEACCICNDPDLFFIFSSAAMTYDGSRRIVDIDGCCCDGSASAWVYMSDV